VKTLPNVLLLAPSSVDAQQFSKRTAYDSTNTLIFKREQASGSSKERPGPSNVWLVQISEASLETIHDISQLSTQQSTRDYPVREGISTRYAE
jgi:hypothetical protein